MIPAKSEKLEPTTFPAPAYVKNQNDVNFGIRNDDSRTMFSKTIFTVLVALCARLIHSAMKERESSVVALPTVEPGLKIS